MVVTRLYLSTATALVILVHATARCSFDCAWTPNVIVYLDPQTRRSVANISALDRSKWIAGHWGTEASGWSQEELDLFGESGYRAHPGRSFVISGRMRNVKQDTNRPGFVNKTDLLQSCSDHPPKVRWPVADLNFISSSKPDQLYNNSCAGPGGGHPKGFMPGSHQATGEFFALYYQHCMTPTLRNRYLMEVANECNVKVHGNKCNTSWQEMIDLHVAVGDALHQAYRQSSPGTPRPVVCGPTAAFPEYQIDDFKNWRANGTFREFVSATINAIDCFSVHLYTSARSTPASDDPFSKNMSWRSANNILATLDLQEVATALLHQQSDPRQPLPLRPRPILVSEYGVSFRDNAPAYAAAHDWWTLRGVNSKLMTFLDRPDRIIRALPFIVGKATWNKAGMANNASNSYPFVLWRNISKSLQTSKQANEDHGTWTPTHLHKFFQVWQNVDGHRFVTNTSDMNLLVQGFRTQQRITVVLHNLRVYEGEDIQANLQWPASLDLARVVNGSIRRLYWDSDVGAPVVNDIQLDVTTSLPSSISLRPGELCVVTISLGLEGHSRETSHHALPWRTTAAIIERTFYSERFLTPLATSAATAAANSFIFQNIPIGARLRLRVGIGGANTSLHAALDNAQVHANGVSCRVDPSTQIGGPLHIQEKDGSVFTSIEIPVAEWVLGARSDDSDTIVNVTIWSPNAGGIVISTAVLIAQYNDASFVRLKGFRHP